MAEEAAAAGTTDAPAPKQVQIQKIYLKDASLECPGVPKIFMEQWQPQVDVQLGTQTNKMADDAHEVTLQVTVTAKQEEQVGFLIEVKQSGIFNTTGFTDTQELRAILGAYCPNILFPFAREAVAEMSQRAGFPQLLLQPVNFDAMFQQHMQQEAAAAEAAQAEKQGEQTH